MVVLVLGYELIATTLASLLSVLSSLKKEYVFKFKYIGIVGKILGEKDFT